MLTVRFPNGQKLTYNDAHYVSRDETFWDLYSDSEKTHWIASIQGSAGGIVESEKPCRVENENIGLTERRAFEIVEAVLSEGRHGERCGSLTAKIKRHLRHFNTKTWRWKS